MSGRDWLKQAASSTKPPTFGASSFRPGGFSESDNSDFSDDGFCYSLGRSIKPVPSFSDDDDDFEPATPIQSMVAVPTPTKPKLVQPLRYAIYKRTKSEIAVEFEKLKADHNFHVNDILEDKDGWTCLMYACHAARADIVSYFIDEGADPAKITGNCSCLLPLVCSVTQDKSCIERCAKVILEHKVVINYKDVELGATALHFAVKSDLCTLVEIFIAKGADVNACDSDRRTPLYWAATRGFGPIVKTLLQSGADMQILSNGGLQAYEAAAFAGFVKISKALYNFGRSKDSAILDLNVWNKNEIAQNDDKYTRKGLTLERNDVANVLFQLKIRRYLPLFESKNIKLEDFLQMRDDDFKNLGIESVGDRIKLMDAIRQMHTNDWKPSSLLNFPPNGMITFFDGVCLCQNIEQHLKLMSASMNYLAVHAAMPSNRISLLNPGFDNKTETNRIREYCGNVIQSADTLIATSKLLGDFVNKIKGNVEFQLGDYFAESKK